MDVRVSRSARNRMKRISLYPSEEQHEGPSVFEKAYEKISFVGKFMKSKFGSIVDYMYSETPKRSQSRNKVVPIPQLKHHSSIDDVESE